MVLGSTLFYLGDVETARQHLEQARTLYDPHQDRFHFAYHGRQDPGVSAMSYASTVLWLLGYPDQALIQGHEALALARELAHPFTLAIALHWAARLHQCRLESPATQAHGEALIALSTEHGFAQWLAMGTRYRGWALVAQGRVEAGITQMQQTLTASRTMGSGVKGGRAICAGLACRGICANRADRKRAALAGRGPVCGGAP
jgi:predicted ATPase